MPSLINEELMKTNLDIPEGEIKIEGQVNPVYADAINVHNKKKKDTEKALKDKKPELKKPFLGTKGDTTIMPKSKGLARLKLSEDMFKDATEVISPERKKHILQDKRNNRDFWSDIYNELTNIKALEAPHRRLKRKPSERYDSYDIGISIDGAITVSADMEAQLDFAKEVAETYGVEYKVLEHDLRTHNRKFEIKIYPERIVTESLKEDKNGKFVGQFSRTQTDDEMNGFVNLIKTVAQENGFDTSKMTVDNSTNISNKTPYGVGTNIKVTIPIQGKDKPFRASNKDTISGLTNVVFTCTAEKGYSDYDNHIDQLKIDKGLDKDDFDAEQFTIRATTNGTVKPYRKRYTHRLEGKGHYMYTGIIEDFRQDLDTYFRELKTYLGI